jgi:transposase-like protein
MADNRDSTVATREFIAERDLRILKMRQAGVSVQEIARRFQISTSATNKAIDRQLQRMNREALMAYPEVLRLELERLDSLQSAIWPMTQHRKLTMDDGTEVHVEPDLKAIQQVLSIMDRRSKLLGMESQNVNVKMDIDKTETIRISMSGEAGPAAVSQFSAETEARQLLEIMLKSGVVSQGEISRMLGSGEILDAEVVEDDGEQLDGE